MPRAFELLAGGAPSTPPRRTRLIFRVAQPSRFCFMRRVGFRRGVAPQLSAATTVSIVPPYSCHSEVQPSPPWKRQGKKTPQSACLTFCGSEL